MVPSFDAFCDMAWSFDFVHFSPLPGLTIFHSGTATAAPSTGATRYTHNAARCPDKTAGASERAGFIDAPQIGPANIASNPMTPPTAMPAMTPVSFGPVDTLRITSMSRPVSTASSAKDCQADPAGIVAPRAARLPNIPSNAALAAKAPISCAVMYGPTH